MARYLTDGVHLYEIAAERVVQNAGCYERSGGRHTRLIRYIILRDCMSGTEGRVDELSVAALTEVPSGAVQDH